MRQVAAGISLYDIVHDGEVPGLRIQEKFLVIQGDISVRLRTASVHRIICKGISK